MKRYVPRQYVDQLLVTFPHLYSTVGYESQQSKEEMSVLYDLLGKDIPGNIIECGVYRGGTTATMAMYLKERAIQKKIYALDSFGGFVQGDIEAEIQKGLVPSEGRTAFTVNSADYVRTKLGKLGVLGLVEIIPGYFEDTLEHIDDTFSLALIDCDLEKSIEFCLARLWGMMQEGGHVVVDDYSNPGYPGARLASDRFFETVVYRRKEVRHGLLVVEK